eukprot:scaffold345037_cov20-Prasinocladus_malaysianus.AAC.1
MTRAELAIGHLNLPSKLLRRPFLIDCWGPSAAQSFIVMPCLQPARLAMHHWSDAHASSSWAFYGDRLSSGPHVPLFSACNLGYAMLAGLQQSIPLGPPSSRSSDV